MVDSIGAQTKLQRILLSWDYWELVAKAEEGGGPFAELRSVPNTFADLKEYQDVFEPLLLEECCAQILRGVEEGEVLEPHPAVVAMSEAKDDFLYTRLAVQQASMDYYSDNDLVLLCKDNPMGEDEEALQTSSNSQELHALGYCEGYEGTTSLRIKFMLSDESQLGNAKGLARVRSMRTGLLTPGSCWWLLKLSNMSTINREWVALQHAHLCPFADIMVGCKPRSAPSSRHMDIPPGMKETMEAQCNGSQMGALQAGLDGTPVVLIQGPPGTGKTRTILNLLSVVMHAAQKGSLELMRIGKKNASNGTAQDSLSQEERGQLWITQSPWVSGGVSPLETITAYDPPGPSRDCFGLIHTKPLLKLGANSGPKAHVLVCAPSNSALDEIVLRIIKSGLMDQDGNMYAPSIVRIGVNCHHSVQSVALDKIVETRMGSGAGGSKGAMSRIERDRMRLAILEEASIVCSTLSFAGSPMLHRLSRKFDVVIIDEAAQAVEPSTLVPLIMGWCKQAYLVGDPVQLPATVLSTRAREHAYDCSLFKRLQVSGYPVNMLDTQYRMHPDISAFPSRQFYAGGLLNGESVIADTQSPWHAQPCFGPLAFYDVTGKESTPPNGASIQNKTEANMVLCIYRELVHRYPSLRKTASVAVISPYKAQVKLLRDAFAAALGEEQAMLVDVNTIDGFQGREKDIVVFSCVRSLRPGAKSIGFVADERRINVGLTRARCSLIVVGNARALQSNGNWASLIHDSLTKGCLYRPKAPFADWMTSAAAGKIGPVIASQQELNVLDIARAKLAKARARSEVKPKPKASSNPAEEAQEEKGAKGKGPNKKGEGAKESALKKEGEEGDGEGSGKVVEDEALLLAKEVEKVEGEGMGEGDEELAEELREEEMGAEDEGDIEALQKSRAAQKEEKRKAEAAGLSSGPTSGGNGGRGQGGRGAKRGRGGR